MQYLPIFTLVKNKNILVVGGGSIAMRKARTLVRAGARVTLVAPEFNTEIKEFAKTNGLYLIHAEFKAQHLAEQVLVIAATNKLSVNSLVYQSANRKGIFVNVVDDLKRSTFIFPSIIDRSPITIAISSAGAAPVLVRRIREKLESIIPQHIGVLANLVGNFRSQVKAKLTGFDARRQFWENVFNSEIDSQVAKGNLEQAKQLLEKQLNSSCEFTSGEVYIVGGGPGSPDLLTLRALQLMQQADVVVYDRLVSDAVLDLVRRDAELISVGKKAGFHSVPQNDINSLLIKLASKGKKVCRLKGGDPFIFGRGAEEIEELVKHNISFQVVPGITAASGCAAYAGIPLTHRDHAQSVQFITGHIKDNGQAVDWQGKAKLNQTLVIYMGLMNSKEIVEKLITYGRPPNTPIAIVEQVSMPSQRVVTGRLDQLVELATQHQISSPALIIVGEVVSLRQTCGWFNRDIQITSSLNHDRNPQLRIKSAI